MSWRYFNRDEFACKCGCKQNRVEDRLIAALDRVREAAGFPLVVTSGYRCPVHNCKVSTTGPHGPHTTGLAADLAVDRERAYYVMRISIVHGFTGFGFQQKGEGRFLHLDLIAGNPRHPRPRIWSY